MAKFNFASLEKKESKNEITPEDNNQKVEDPQHKKVLKSDLTPKDPKTNSRSRARRKIEDQKLNEIDIKIDNKINEIVNDRILKLVKLGLKHELTIENMIQYFKETKRLKLYNLTRYFSDANPGKIDQMLQFLYTTKVLRKDRNGWYRLKNAHARNFSNLSK